MKKRIRTDFGWKDIYVERTPPVRRSEEEKLKIIRDYYENNLSIKEVCLKYEIENRSIFKLWLAKYTGDKSVSLHNKEDNIMKDSSVKSADTKDAEIKRLRKALEIEQLRSKGFETMITEAEKVFNIPIRKKSGTKR